MEEASEAEIEENEGLSAGGEEELVHILDVVVCQDVVSIMPSGADAKDFDVDSARVLADQGNVQAQLDLAIACQNAENVADAVSWFVKAAVRGNAYAQNQLGRLASDNSTQLYWFRLSAEGGYSIGIRNFADTLIASGQRELGLRWYDKLACLPAQHGQLPNAAYAAAAAFRHDEKEALRFFQLAVAQSSVPRKPSSLAHDTKKDVFDAGIAQGLPFEIIAPPRQPLYLRNLVAVCATSDLPFPAKTPRLSDWIYEYADFAMYQRSKPLDSVLRNSKVRPAAVAI